MKFKNISCFLEETLLIFFCVTFVCVVFITRGDVEIGDFSWAFIVTSTLSIILWIFLFSRTVRLGVASFLDFVFQNVVNDEYLVTGKQEIYSSTFVLRKDESDNDFRKYYLLYAQKNGEVYTFISANDIPFLEGRKYMIFSGALSGVLAGYNEVETDDSENENCSA